MKKILLSQGKFALVDDQDYKKLNQYKWYFHNEGYAQRSSGNKKIYMHREIMNFPEGIVDHINLNRLDNRRSNLRICNSSQNKMNSNKISSNTSGYRGVVWDKSRKRWKVQIKLNQKNINLGRFISKKQAILVRQLAERQYFGEFARL